MRQFLPVLVPHQPLPLRLGADAIGPGQLASKYNFTGSRVARPRPGDLRKGRPAS
jgi:hypothetical protein